MGCITSSPRSTGTPEQWQKNGKPQSNAKKDLISDGDKTEGKKALYTAVDDSRTKPNSNGSNALLENSSKTNGNHAPAEGQSSSGIPTSTALSLAKETISDSKKESKEAFLVQRDLPSGSNSSDIPSDQSRRLDVPPVAPSSRTSSSSSGTVEKRSL